MTKYLSLLALIFVTSAMASDNLTLPSKPSKRVIQNPKTKVCYYLESDLQHIAAISSSGGFLWCCGIVPPPKHGSGWFVDDFGLWTDPKTGKEYIRVKIWAQGFREGFIDRKTGIFSHSVDAL